MADDPAPVPVPYRDDPLAPFIYADYLLGAESHGPNIGLIFGAHQVNHADPKAAQSYNQVRARVVVPRDTLANIVTFLQAVIGEPAKPSPSPSPNPKLN